MRHLLRVGQVFRCPKFTDLGYIVEAGPDETFSLPPQPNRTRLEFSHTRQTTCCWTEHGQDGWKRSREQVVDLTPEDAGSLGAREFVVVETILTGGGTGHGPHDVYPDGHHVVAQEVGGERLVRFYQSGCFVGMRPPEDIELIRGPADAPNPAGRQPPSVWVTGPRSILEQAADEHLFEILDNQR